MVTRRSPAWLQHVVVLSILGALCFSFSTQAAPPAAPVEEGQMASEEIVHHSLNYIEFTVTDMARAQKFYGAAFGWTFQDYGPDYAGIKVQGREVAGLRLDTKVTTGGPLVVLNSENLELSLEKVRDAGGPIVQEPFEFPGGRRFHFKDPDGTELAVWSKT